MDWLEGTENNPRLIVINEHDYRGIKCKYVDKFGWKIVLGNEEYLFPNFQEARFAIDRFHEDVVKKYGAVKLKTK